MYLIAAFLTLTMFGCGKSQQSAQEVLENTTEIMGTEEPAEKADTKANSNQEKPALDSIWNMSEEGFTMKTSSDVTFKTIPAVEQNGITIQQHVYQEDDNTAIIILVHPVGFAATISREKAEIYRSPMIDQYKTISKEVNAEPVEEIMVAGAQAYSQKLTALVMGMNFAIDTKVFTKGQYLFVAFNMSLTEDYDRQNTFTNEMLDTIEIVK